MARSLEDARRSLKRFMSIVLGDDWEVRLEPEEGSFERPICVVRAVNAAVVSGPAHTTNYTRPFVLYLYPERFENVEQGQIRIDRLQQLILDAFLVGDQQNGAYPRRVPLYDYEGTDWGEGTDYRDNREFMRLDDIQPHADRDPEDDLLWTVVFTLRLSWRRRGRVLPIGPALESVMLEVDTPQ